MENKGLIFDIQSFSVHDGPGCRTNVFFTGCPLQCQWCANPESWVLKKHIMFSERVCKWGKGCKACDGKCPYNSISFDTSGKPSITWDICKDCETFDCTLICPNNALKQCVKELSIDDLMKILRRDFSNWGPDGGVTFSGGEPLMQHKYLIEILKRCKKMQIHTAIETSGFTSEEIFLEVMKYIHFAFVDVKNMDDEMHRVGTGVSNKQILSNISALKKSGWKGRLVLRTPIIGGYNDSIENAKKCIEFMNDNDLYEINLLKFHRLGSSKWDQLGRDYMYNTVGTGDVTEEQLSKLQEIYLDNKIACYIADNTPF